MTANNKNSTNNWGTNSMTSSKYQGYRAGNSNHSRMNTKNGTGKPFPINGVISSRGVGFEFPRGKGIDVQNRDRNKPKKAQPEEKHFERESHFSDAKNKLLIPEWRENQLMQNTYSAFKVFGPTPKFGHF